MWTIERIKALGFELITNEKLWCHFRGHGFDVFVNLKLYTHLKYEEFVFNFRSYKSNFKGNFRARILNDEEFNLLLKIIQ